MHGTSKFRNSTCLSHSILPLITSTGTHTATSSEWPLTRPLFTRLVLAYSCPMVLPMRKSNKVVVRLSQILKKCGASVAYVLELNSNTHSHSLPFNITPTKPAAYLSST